MHVGLEDVIHVGQWHIEITRDSKAQKQPSAARKPLNVLQAREARERGICANSWRASCRQKTGFSPVGQLLLMLVNLLLGSSAVAPLCHDSWQLLRGWTVDELAMMTSGVLMSTGALTELRMSQNLVKANAQAPISGQSDG